LARIKYRESGDVLSLPVALTQAATALDEAGQMASKRDDMDALIKIGRAWIDLANLLANPEEEFSEEHDTTSRVIGFGE
jgi:hypothetical protein